MIDHKIKDNWETYVQAQTDIRTPTDIGTHSSFAEMQDKDGTFDLLTEGDTGGAGIDENLNVDGYSNDYNSFDTEEGASPYLDLQDEPTNYIHEAKSSGATSGWYTFEDTLETTTDISVTLYFWCYGDDTNDQIRIYEDWTGSGGGTHQETLTVTLTSYGSYLSVPLDTSTHTAAEINLLRVYFYYQGVGGGDDIYIDHVYARIEKAAGSVYDLDLEVGWTTADFDETTGEELCIFGGTQGSEALRVDVWSGSWINVFTDIAAGWNNVSVASYLVDATFEIRFTDTSDEAVEADTWQVEGVLLHVWTAGGDSYYVTINEIVELYDSTTTAVNWSQIVQEIIELYDSTSTVVNWSQIVQDIIDFQGIISTVLNTTIGISETLDIVDRVTTILNPSTIITLIINEIIPISYITGEFVELNIFSEIFLSSNMWGYLGPIALVVIGFLLTKKEKSLGIFMFIVDCLVISQYLSLVDATPGYWWHIIILLLGVIQCIIQMIDR